MLSVCDDDQYDVKFLFSDSKMENKTHEEDPDNKFVVDEPGELKPGKIAPAKGANKRTSTGGKHRVTLIRKKKDGKDYTAKGKAKHYSNEDDLNEEEVEDGDFDYKWMKEKDENTPREYRIGEFLILKTDFINAEHPPRIFRIDRKHMLQKYIPYDKKVGSPLYKSTKVYRPWGLFQKNQYFPITVIHHEHRPLTDEHDTNEVNVVEFYKDISRK